MKTLTVIVSAYESGEWIENRLVNLFNSTFKNEMDVWVINADSPDERDHKIPQQFPVNYIKLPERIGVYAAWNYAIKNSKSKFITSANTDDIVSPNCYEKLAKDLKYHDFTYPSWYTTEKPNLTWNDVSTTCDPSGLPGRYNGDLSTSGVGHFPMWKRSLHDRLGLFDENFKALGDAEWWARCFYKAKATFYWRREMMACYLFRNGQNLWHRFITQTEWDNYHSKVASYK